jgi:hypothetical protein
VRMSFHNVIFEVHLGQKFWTAVVHRAPKEQILN